MSLSKAEKYLQAHDPLMKKLIGIHGHLETQVKGDYFASLARSIVSQQISVKAARSIFIRLTEASQLDPSSTLQLSSQAMQSIGLSSQKQRYLQDLASHFINSPNVFQHLNKLPDDDVITELTKIHGIGVWTAQMFMISTLSRPDVFAPLDRGIQIAIQNLYQLTAAEAKQPIVLNDIAEVWRPYRTTACLHLWHSLKNE